LEGVKIRQLRRLPDERGLFTEMMRADWGELLGEDRVMQANLSSTYPNVVRAWHRHELGQVDYFVVIRGAAKICAYDEATKGMDAVVSTGESLQVVRVPGHYWHGFKVLGPEPAMIAYFMNKLYDYAHPDELRRPWDDEAVVPRSINGRQDDPRCNRPWDWLAPPHR
jgi:dTDP-4-dehydrorhamnose 3,5-epimerase